MYARAIARCQFPVQVPVEVAERGRPGVCMSVALAQEGVHVCLCVCVHVCFRFVCFVRALLFCLCV